VLGAASVVGEVVYVGVIGPNIGTFGFDAKTGKKVFEHELGDYNPVISDGRRLYLTGTSNIRAFEHKDRKPKGDRRRRAGREGGDGEEKGRRKARGSDARRDGERPDRKRKATRSKGT
jgi:hypothetical protein